MLNSNKPIKVTHLKNESMLNGAIVRELAFSERKKNFGRLKKRGTF